MTTRYHELVDQSYAAERAGNASRALELHTSVPMFGKGRHAQVLERLAGLGDDLPEWVWARWIVYQATRCGDAGTHTGDLHQTALRYVADAFHADQVADCHADGGDPIKVVAHIASESWFFQQVFVHEMRGLESFLGEFPSGRLSEHCELASSWIDRPLGGYQVGASTPGGRLRVLDPVTDSWMEVLDLGASFSAGDGGWVLGRLVPSGIDDLQMFDVPPIAVSEAVAHAVARAPRPWGPVAEALEEGRLVERHFMREDYELTTDVQELDLLRFGTLPQDLERVMAQLRSGRDEISRAAFRVLRRAADGQVRQADSAYVAAAALNPTARAQARSRILRDGQYDVWVRWAELVHDPARRLLLDFARTTRAVG